MCLLRKPTKIKETPWRKPSFIRLCLIHVLAPQAYEKQKTPWRKPSFIRLRLIHALAPQAYEKQKHHGENHHSLGFA